jgi:hypothetical protein
METGDMKRVPSVQIHNLEEDEKLKALSVDSSDSSTTKSSLPSSTEKFADEKGDISEDVNEDAPYDPVARVPTNSHSILETGIVGWWPTAWLELY